MEIIKSEGRGRSTVYTVKDGNQEKKLTTNEVPDDIIKKWRNKQSASCMRRKRTTAQSQPDAPPEVQVRAAPQPGSSSDQQTADEKITCKICRDAESSRAIFPCGHLAFCGPCLTKAMSQKNTCPICRKDIKDHLRVII